jgi:site-specific DNA recombinase
VPELHNEETAMSKHGSGPQAGVYVRISRDVQGEGQGTTRQEGECREHAAKLGWLVVKVYCDNDISAFSGKRRPAYEQMLADVAAGKIQAIIAVHPDRLYRQTKELERFITIVGDLPIETVRGGKIDFSTATSRMIAKTLGNLAQWESEQKGERQKSKMRQLRLSGILPTPANPPFGFNKDWTHNEEQRDVLFKSWALLRAGQSLSDVRRWWETTEIGGRRRWRTSTVRRMVLNPTCAGLILEPADRLAGRFSPDHIIGKASNISPMITAEEYWELHALLQRRGWGGRRETGGRKTLFTRGLRCWCGAPMTMHRNRGRGTAKYQCRANDDHRDACGGNSIELELENYVAQAAIRYGERPKLESYIAVGDESERSKLRARLENLELKLDKLRVDWRKYDMSDEEFERHQQDQLREIREVRAKLGIHQAQSPDEFADYRGKSGKLGRAWVGFSQDQRWQMRYSAFPVITILPRARYGKSGVGFDPRRVLFRDLTAEEREHHRANYRWRRGRSGGIHWTDRETVSAASRIMAAMRSESVSQQELSWELGLPPTTTRGRIYSAIKSGWLVPIHELRRGRRNRYKPARSLPEAA